VGTSRTDRWAVPPLRGQASLVHFQLLAALIGPISHGGWLLSAGTRAPKFSRMNHGAGLKRMFSTKFFIVMSVPLMVLSADIDDLLRIAHRPLDRAIIHSLRVVGWSTLWKASGLIR